MSSGIGTTRNLLHYNKLSLFRLWCRAQRFEANNGCAEFEVMRLTMHFAQRIKPIIFYKRLRTDHVTTFGKGTELVERWLRERNNDKSS